MVLKLLKINPQYYTNVRQTALYDTDSIVKTLFWHQCNKLTMVQVWQCLQ